MDHVVGQVVDVVGHVTDVDLVEVVVHADHVQTVGGAGAGVGATIGRVGSVYAGVHHGPVHLVHGGVHHDPGGQHHGWLDDRDTVSGWSVADCSVSKSSSILCLLRSMNLSLVRNKIKIKAKLDNDYKTLVAN